MDLLEFEELRRSETTDKLPFLGREKTHTPRMDQSDGQEAEREVNELRNDKIYMYSADRQ